LKYADKVLSQKIDLCPAGKILFDFPLAIFSPQCTVCESRTIIAWPKGEKLRHRGKKYHIFSPSWFFVLFLAFFKEKIYKFH
jgi:hypothetical protein